MFCILFCLLAISHAMPTVPTGIFLSDPDVSETNPDTMEVVQVGSQLFFRDMDGTMIPLDSEAEPEKKREKLPHSKKDAKSFGKTTQPRPAFQNEDSKDYDVMSSQPGVAPKLTGFTVDSLSNEDKLANFNFGEGAVAMTNPASTFLEGGNFDKLSAPKCKMTGCVGPMPNDGSFSVVAEQGKNEACHQTFVPMNGCVDGKGYPMGMMCTICCECASDFVAEMKKTNGFKTGYQQ